MMEGFTRTEIKTSGARIVTVHGGKGPPLLLLHGNPFTHLSWHKFAPRLAQEFTVVATDLRGYGDSSKPPGGNEPRELFVPRHGAGPGRGDGASRLQEIHGGRPRPRRARDAPHVPRSSGRGRARRDPRHHPAAQPLHPHDARMGQGVLPLVVHDPARADARDADERRPGFLHQHQARQDPAGPELLRQGGAGGIPALLPQPATVHAMCEDYRATVSASISTWTRSISPPARRSPVRR